MNQAALVVQNLRGLVDQTGCRVLVGELGAPGNEGDLGWFEQRVGEEIGQNRPQLGAGGAVADRHFAARGGSQRLGDPRAFTNRLHLFTDHQVERLAVVAFDSLDGGVDFGRFHSSAGSRPFSSSS